MVESNYTLARDTRNPDVLNTKGITNYKDHTSGDGLFFLVNGAKNRNSLVWEQTIAGLRLGQRYRFTLWVSRWTPNQSTAAKLSILIDGAEYDSFEDPNVSGTWVKHTVTFMPTNNSPVLQIRNLESALYGNDFALDDLSIEVDSDPSTSPPPPSSLGIARILGTGLTPNVHPVYASETGVGLTHTKVDRSTPRSRRPRSATWIGSINAGIRQGSATSSA